MSDQPIERKPLNFSYVIETLIALQIALSKLVIALMQRQAKGPVFVFRHADGSTDVVDESCGEVPEDDSRDKKRKPDEGPNVDESCGEHPTWFGRNDNVDDNCGEISPIPPVCGDDTVELLCDRLIKIAMYLKQVCRIVRS